MRLAIDRPPPAVPVPFGHGDAVAQLPGLIQLVANEDRLTGVVDSRDRHPGVPDISCRQALHVDGLAGPLDFANLPRLVMMHGIVGDLIA